MATQYAKVTHKELIALLEVVDSMNTMAESGDNDFSEEAKDADNAITAIFTRNKLVRPGINNVQVTFDNAYDSLS